MTRRPALGYVMVLTAAIGFRARPFAPKVILQSGGFERLTEVRATGAFLLLFAVLAALDLFA